MKKGLFLLLTVSRVEFVHAAGGVDEFHLARVERVGSVGDLDFHQRERHAVNVDRFLRTYAGTGDEDVFVGHILECYKTVGFGMDSFFHDLSCF